MVDASLPRQCGTDCTQPISHLIRQPGGHAMTDLHCQAHLRWSLQHVNWNPSMWRNVKFSNEWKCGDDVVNAMLIAAPIETNLLVEAKWWCGAASPSLEKWSLISRWNSATSGNPISPQSLFQLYPPKWQCLTPTERDLSETTSILRMERPASSSNFNPNEPLCNQTGCTVCAKVTSNHAGWLVTNAVLKNGMPFHRSVAVWYWQRFGKYFMRVTHIHSSTVAYQCGTI